VYSDSGPWARWKACLWGLTFELSGGRRRGAWAARPMMTLAGSRPKCLAGGRPLERRVRPHQGSQGARRGWVCCDRLGQLKMFAPSGSKERPAAQGMAPDLQNLTPSTPGVRPAHAVLRLKAPMANEVAVQVPQCCQLMRLRLNPAAATR
jgi:hypothetical protein